MIINDVVVVKIAIYIEKLLINLVESTQLLFVVPNTGIYSQYHSK